MFNVGDKVLIHRPRNGSKDNPDEPTWVPSMERYDGAEGCISKIENRGRWARLKGQPWAYSVNWLSPIDDEEEEFEVGDLSMLMER